MSNQSDTPETDEVFENCLPPMGAESAFSRMLEHSLKLERERNEARKVAEQMRGWAKPFIDPEICPLPWE